MRISDWSSDVCSSDLKDLLPPGSKPDAIEAAKQLVSRAKNAGLSPEEAAAAETSVREREAAALYKRYQQRLSAFNAGDFDDLIRLPVRLLDRKRLVAVQSEAGRVVTGECGISTINCTTSPDADGRCSVNRM